jgi:ribonuclease HI
MDEKPKVEIWCDGAAEPSNPGPAAWGAILVYGSVRKELSGYIGIASNQVAEVTAAIEGLQALKKPCQVTVYSDSKYLVEGANGNWNIRTNLGVWDKLRQLQRLHEVTFVWVKGHNGNANNERTNQLANNAAYRGALKK